MDAENLLLEIREIASPYLKTVKGTLVSVVLDLSDVRCLHHVWRNNDTTRGIFKTLSEIGHVFVQDLGSVAGARAAGTGRHPSSRRADDRRMGAGPSQPRAQMRVHNR